MDSSSWTTDRRESGASSLQKTYNLAPVEFRTILRLRPLSKKEREDHVILEVQNSKSQSSKPSVVMRPLPRTEKAPGFLSPERSQHHQTEYRFDRVFSEHASQDAEVFGQIGRHMTSISMEPLFLDSATPRAHVNIAMGTHGSGKTYTCFGDCSQSMKRKNPSDGMIPRAADSLFKQFQRLSSQYPQKTKSCYFAVNISAVQVNQPKNPKSTSADAGKLFDLLQYTSYPHSIARRASFGRNVSLGSSSGGSDLSTPSLPKDTPAAAMKGKPVNKNVYIDQDPLTHDFRVVNEQVRSCHSTEEARGALQDILFGVRKASNKRNQCHVLVHLQPVMIGKKKKTIQRKGGSIVFLDMAGCEDLSTSQSRQRILSKRLRDCLPSRGDAHACLSHCLRSILHNEQHRRTVLKSASASRDTSLSHHHSAKQVPYLQHKVTMLLQPFFSKLQSELTTVQMLVTASPSHKDYLEKRGLLSEIESLWAPFHPASVQACTGVQIVPSDSNRRQSRSVPRARPSQSKEDSKPASLQRRKSSASYEYSLPPPVAPPKPSFLPARDLSAVEASPAKTYEKTVVDMDRINLVDFPGVIMGTGPLPQSTPSPKELHCGKSKHGTPAPPPSLAHTTSSKKSRSDFGRSKSQDNSRTRSRSRTPLRPTPSNHAKSYKRKDHGSKESAEQPNKKTWSRTVETTTIIETSDNIAHLDSPSQASLEHETTDNTTEMEDLRRQNERLQRELQKLKSNPRKSVSWKEDKTGSDRNRKCDDSSRSRSPPRTKLMASPILRDQMARLASKSDDGTLYSHSTTTNRTSLHRFPGGSRIWYD